LPSNFQSLPSRTVAKPAQRQKHISQKVAVVVTAPGPPAAWAKGTNGRTAVAAAAPPKVAAEICRNRLLDTLGITSSTVAWQYCHFNAFCMDAF
jgi:hypothetical protein